MKIRLSKITFNILSYLANKTRGNAFVVKYKLLIGTFLLSATQVTAQAQDVIPVKKNPVLVLPRVSCYIATPPFFIMKAKVEDENNKPLVGVSVSAKGKDISTVSKEDGSFEIKTLPNEISVLVFSCIGYETQEIKAEKITQNSTIVMIEDKTI